MDAIMRDIASAGSGAPTIVQTFTPLLDGVGPQGPFGQNTDELEIITNPTNFSSEPACGLDANVSEVYLTRNSTLVTGGRTILISLTDGTWTMRTINPGVVPTGTPPPGSSCTGANHMRLQFTTPDPLPGGPGFNTALCNVSGNPIGNSNAVGPGLAPCAPAGVTLAEQVRYRIRPGADGVPNLERRTTAAFGAGFQVVARGIEDLQVQYVQVNSGCTIAAPCASAPLVTLTQNPPPDPDYNLLITQVTVTLSSRSALQRIQGQTQAPTGPNALRGSLTSTGTPRAALFALTQEPVDVPMGIPKWH